MNVEQVLELGKLGFSKNEIMGIINAQNMTRLNQITTAQGTEVIQNQQPTTNVGTATGGDATSTALLTAINTLTATLQAGNLNASGQQATHARTSDDVASDLMKLMN